MFYGLGSDGTVGANKNSIKIIGEDTDNYAQGYFVYDSKKSGSVTVSHLRFGPEPIRSTYLVDQANFVACHQWVFLEQLRHAQGRPPGATFLLNSLRPGGTWDQLPRWMQEQIIDKKLKVYAIDAYKVAREAGMGNRINTVMQTCFFAISGVLPDRTRRSKKIKNAIARPTARRASESSAMNFEGGRQHPGQPARVPGPVTGESHLPTLPGRARRRRPGLRQEVSREDHGRPGRPAARSAPCPPTAPSPPAPPSGRSATSPRRSRSGTPTSASSAASASWSAPTPRSAPRSTTKTPWRAPRRASRAPSTTSAKDFWDLKFTIQVAPEDCTGCGLCVDVCPAKNKAEPKHKAINMSPSSTTWSRAGELGLLPRAARPRPQSARIARPRAQQMQEPLFEFSGACAGCGETPYVKLLSQLFGDRMLVANATGCSSIYGGNLPTTPGRHNANGRGPAWSNSLFEDNAEFGLGFRLAIDKQDRHGQELLHCWSLKERLGATWQGRSSGRADRRADIVEQRRAGGRSARQAQAGLKTIAADDPGKPSACGSLADYLVKARASGSSAATAGPTTSATAASTTCWPAGATSTSWCSTPRSTPTPAARCPRPPRSGAVAKFAAGGKPAPRRTWA
jgi:pyruvate-ferredoxin/flavodoxin oxidoreductase